MGTTILLPTFSTGTARSAQERLNAVWDLVFNLPVYRSLRLDTEAARSLFPDLLSDRAKWLEVLDVDSEGHRMFEEFLSGLEYFAESLRNFRGQLDGMPELYFEPLTRHHAEAYAEAYAAYFTDMAATGKLFSRNRNLSRAFTPSFALSRWYIRQRKEKSCWRKRWSSIISPTFSTPIFTGA